MFYIDALGKVVVCVCERERERERERLYVDVLGKAICQSSVMHVIHRCIRQGRSERERERERGYT